MLRWLLRSLLLRGRRVIDAFATSWLCSSCCDGRLLRIQLPQPVSQRQGQPIIIRVQQLHHIFIVLLRLLRPLCLRLLLRGLSPPPRAPAAVARAGPCIRHHCAGR